MLSRASQTPSLKLLSLFQAMKKGLVPAEQAVRLLQEAQVATGEVIGPTSHHHLPILVALQCGYIDQGDGVGLV